MGEAHFSKGLIVEVCSDDEGLRGVWFVATVLRAASKKNKVLVEYQTLTADKKGTRPLREFADVVNLRPVPPREADRSFNSSDEVDAYHNDGWWEGVVIKVLENSRYLIYFRPGKEELEFKQADLRIHREWVHGSWVPPMEGVAEEEAKPLKHKEEKKQNNSTGSEINPTKKSAKLEVEFNEGMIVEVSSDEEGFVGCWFSARIVEAVGKNKFVVEYQTLRTDDESALLKEEAERLHIRPPPPETPQIDSFSRLEEVDAFYNDAWWVGVVSKVLGDSRYIVYFRESNEEIEFSHSQLRLHQDWIDGKWVRASEALML